LISDTGSREWRGEITVVVGGGRKARDMGKDSDRDRDREIRVEIHKLRAEGMRVKEIAEILGERFSMSKREVYRLALEKTDES
jgi:16S rRNA C1402 (ribose-2'-O) methylase RsmI